MGEQGIHTSWMREEGVEGSNCAGKMLWLGEGGKGEHGLGVP